MQQILLETIKEMIKKWDVRDIYAFSLFVYDENDNPSRPTVTLRYNTEQYFFDKIDDFCFITQKLAEEFFSIVQELHLSGFIRNKFKKDIPILIHELEYYDKIAE